MKKYDVIIVGAGPAGIFAALELVSSRRKLRVLMIEKGPDIDERSCPSAESRVPCISCTECGLLCGWGGAGAFSDGKLSLSKEVGGNLSQYTGVRELERLIRYVDGIYVKFGAPARIHGTNRKKVDEIREIAEANGMTLIPSRIRHIGTDRCSKVLKKMKRALNSKVEIRFHQDVRKIITNNGAIAGVDAGNGNEYYADYVIVAPGREGAMWLERQAKKVGLSMAKNPVDIGVRVELPADVLEPLTQVIYEPKLIYRTKKFNDRIRTFCVNPYGEVVKENVKGVWTVNGHSYSDRKTANTNFALLVSTRFTEPFDEPHLYGRYVARLANLLGRGVLIQRLGDLKEGRRSTADRIARGKVKPTMPEAVPGDLSFVLPHRYLTDILDMLGAMDKIAPGVNNAHTLLYGVEVKFYSRQIVLTKNLETETANLFAVGDGAGVSRGLIQASASGVVAAREVLSREQGKRGTGKKGNREKREQGNKGTGK